MYILPQIYKCEKCGYECSYSPHDEHPAPALSVGDKPVIACPQCYAEWLHESIGTMQRKSTEP